MKSQIKEKAKVSEYPTLKVYVNDSGDKSIILFTNANCGVCVYSSVQDNVVGDYHGAWMEHLFKPFSGEVTISN